MNPIRKTAQRSVVLFYAIFLAPFAHGYSFDQVVPDVRQPASLSGGSACPVPAHQLSAAGSIPERWSTALNSNPATIITQNQTPAGQLAEIEAVITQSMAVWTGLSGTALLPASFVILTQPPAPSACVRTPKLAGSS